MLLFNRTPAPSTTDCGSMIWITRLVLDFMAPSSAQFADLIVHLRFYSKH